jgi:hypothetical protein
VLEVDRDDLLAFIDLAVDRMMAKATLLGPRVSERPDLDGANSVFGLVTHCVGVTEWWLGHVVLGRDSARDRSAEFTATGSVVDLEQLVARFRATLPGLVDEVVSTPVPRSAPVEQLSAGPRPWPWSTASICLHVVEELFQHAGHVDLTTDLLLREQ